MALSHGVPVLVLGDVHDEAGDGAHGYGRSCAAADKLMDLIVGLPAPAQLKARLLPMLQKNCCFVHTILVEPAPQPKLAASGQQAGDRKQSHHPGILFEPMQSQLSPE